MRAHIELLHRLAGADIRRIMGMMSGTSLDGLDLALCAITGCGFSTRVELLGFESVPYDDAFRDRVRRVFARRQIDQLDLALLNVHIAEVHAAMVQGFLARRAHLQVDLLASHGQTVFHAPINGHGLAGEPNATLQLGDGDHLAVRTGRITICDFRQKHVAIGGEGAPLALYGDYLLFSSDLEDRLLLNIGGIANVTFLPRSGDPGAPLATDTGPGNTLLDAGARHLFGVPFDRDGLLAARGQVLPALLERWLGDPYFTATFPLTTGPERFSWAMVTDALQAAPKGHNNPYDVMRTLTELSAQTIADAMRRVQRSELPTTLYASGGGADNPVLMGRIGALLPDLPIRRTDDLGIPAAAKEAVLFAVLANEAIAGTPQPDLQGLPWVGMGKIAFPG
jgi:anhydro-N-acetylmuramic acid kinase